LNRRKALVPVGEVETEAFLRVHVSHEVLEQREASAIPGRVEQVTAQPITSGSELAELAKVGRGLDARHEDVTGEALGAIGKGEPITARNPCRHIGRNGAERRRKVMEEQGGGLIRIMKGREPVLYANLIPAALREVGPVGASL